MIIKTIYIHTTTDNNMISANNARIGLGLHTYDETLNNGTFRAKQIYLGYLCAHGEFDEIARFIRETDHELVPQLLNEPYPIYDCGTVLHILLSWNVGEEACRIFELLVEHGAEYHYANGYLPWEQVPNHEYVSPLTGEIMGHVDENNETNLFLETSNKLRVDLDLRQFENPNNNM
jgi:hypothetical protein